MATLSILCEGIFLGSSGSWASSSVWALTGVQLLLCWSQLSYSIDGWWVMSYLSHRPGGMQFVLWDMPMHCRWGRGWGQQKGSVLSLRVRGRHGAEMKVCATSLCYVIFWSLGVRCQEVRVQTNKLRLIYSRFPLAPRSVDWPCPINAHITGKTLGKY